MNSANDGIRIPLISIVLPVKNEAPHIVAVLESLQAQDYPADRLEIIVCDGGSDDGTPRIVQDFAASAVVPVRVVDNPGVRSSAGRNTGVGSARGEIICFVDGHCRIGSSDMLRAIARLMSDEEVACLSRPQRLYADTENIFQRAVVLARASRLGHGADSTIYDENVERRCDPASAGAIYKREVFQQIGSYDESFDACEDVDFNVRVREAGLTAMISSQLEVFYVARRSPQGLFKQMVRYGSGRIRLMRKHRSERRIPVLVPVALLSLLALWPVAAVLLPPIIRYAWSAAALAYLVLIAVTALWLAMREKDTLLQRMQLAGATLLALLIIHIGLGSGELMELFRAPSNQRHLATARSA